MNPFSIISVKHASFDELSQTVELNVQFEWGKPKPTDHFFCLLDSLETYETSIDLIKTPLLGKPKVYLDGADWEMWGEEGLIEAIDAGRNQFILGPSFDDFHRIPIADQERYWRELWGAWGNERIAPIYLEQFRPCYHVQFLPDHPVHATSKIGGLPFAPVGFEFPDDTKGKKAAFIGQFDLRDLHLHFPHHSLLNQPGILYLFGEIDVLDETSILSELIPIFIPAANNLIQIPLPDSLNDYGILEEVAIEIYPAFSIPHPSSAYFYHLPDFPTNQEDFNLWSAGGLLDYYYPNALKIGGHPTPVQNSIELEAAFKSLGRGWYEKERKDFYDYQKASLECLPEALQWVPIIQIWNGSTPFDKWSNYAETFSHYIGDSIYLMVKSADLKNGTLTQVITISQTT